MKIKPWVVPIIAAGAALVSGAAAYAIPSLHQGLALVAAIFLLGAVASSGMISLRRRPRLWKIPTVMTGMALLSGAMAHAIPSLRHDLTQMAASCLLMAVMFCVIVPFYGWNHMPKGDQQSPLNRYVCAIITVSVLGSLGIRDWLLG